MKRANILFALALSFPAALTAAMNVVPNSRHDRAVQAVNRLGDVLLLARDVNLDRDTSDGRWAKGRLSIIFDRESGLFLQALDWETERYPENLLEGKNTLPIVMPGRIAVLTYGGGIGIFSSTNKAVSLDDAERQALERANSYPGERGTLRGGQTGSSVQFGRSSFPKGFFSGPDYDMGAIVRVKLLGVRYRNESSWYVDLESNDTHQAAACVVTMERNNSWGISICIPLPPSGRKPPI